MKKLKSKKTNVAEKKFFLQLTRDMDFLAIKLFPKQEETQETRKLVQIRACVRSYSYPFFKTQKNDSLRRGKAIKVPAP